MGEEPVSRQQGGVNGTSCPGWEGEEAAPGSARPLAAAVGPGGGHLTRGFTSSFPVTVNMVERPKGVHTAAGGEAKQGVPSILPLPMPPEGSWIGLGAQPCTATPPDPGTICREQPLLPARHPGVLHQAQDEPPGLRHLGGTSHDSRSRSSTPKSEMQE